MPDTGWWRPTEAEMWFLTRPVREPSNYLFAANWVGFPQSSTIDSVSTALRSKKNHLLPMLHHYNIDACRNCDIPNSFMRLLPLAASALSCFCFFIFQWSCVRGEQLLIEKTSILELAMIILSMVQFLSQCQGFIAGNCY